MIHFMKNFMCSSILIIVIVAWFFYDRDCDLLIKTSQGWVKGVRATDGEYKMFMGIPYASVNRSNPFGNSLPYPAFKQIFEANDDSAKCPQREEFNNTLVGDLDCLQMNIYVPKTASIDAKVPVMVHIYGGSFKIGFAGRYILGPRYLVRHGIIYIVFNYRLGPYGFFCLDSAKVSGNQGLKDQIRALRWIKNNIEAFGGNSDQITVAGHSAGATIVDTLFYSLQEEKLFDKAIIQSGTAYMPNIVTEIQNSIPINLANYLGLKTDEMDEALDFLANVDTKILIEASINLNISYNCCIEKTNNALEPYLTDYPISRLQLTLIQNMPIMIGNTNNELAYLYNNIKPEYILEDDLIYHELKATLNANNTILREIAATVHNRYIGIAKTTEDVKTEMTNFVADYYYYNPSKRVMEKFLDNKAKNIFYYIFSYDGNRNFLKKGFNLVAEGAVHADELGYLYDISYMDRNPLPGDQLIIDRMTLLWANFVKYGDPTPSTTELLPVKWEPYTKETKKYLSINKELTMKKNLLPERMAFWDQFYEKYGIYQKSLKHVGN